MTYEMQSAVLISKLYIQKKNVTPPPITTSLLVMIGQPECKPCGIIGLLHIPYNHKPKYISYPLPHAPSQITLPIIK